MRPGPARHAPRPGTARVPAHMGLGMAHLVLVADADMLMHPLAETWAELVHLVQQRGGYSHIITASNSFGKNILPRAAALLDVSPVTDITEISELHLFVRPIYAGNALCTVRYVGKDPCMMTIRSTSFPLHSELAEPKSDAAPISQVDLSTFNEEFFGKSLWLKLASQDTERPDLGNACVVVTGGRGLKSAENFKLLAKLAEKLGAAVGATRAAVDAGFVPNDLQVCITSDHQASSLPVLYGLWIGMVHLIPAHGMLPEVGTANHDLVKGGMKMAFHFDM
ncbi:putative electron transfer flavoprotein subunit alpha, mitochondrial [Cocos nucifera]|uniref:Putative electron transfer flavoprotein subunit alpha, mitochondrial n=1 Tax=Cocos nucifera TaxID=13894 RepID=A0A8K0N9R8_COCNU|nr:putative electron transfer flavoprotein subunit alpha, mitochondrial [Cocos nucifera]